MTQHFNMTSTKIYTFIFTFPFLFLSVSCSILHNFLQCLPQTHRSHNSIRNFIYTPNNSSYSSILKFYARNARILSSRNPKPLAIVAATSESHVQTTVICAKSHGIQIRIRSGGHDYEGLSYISDVPFVILDMFNLRRIDVNIAEETALVQAGATLGELYYAIANQSKVHAFPGGVCPTVGVAGHFTGGGYGNLMRKFGLSVDNIIDARLVDANGRILNRETMGEDVFWAIRGGGGASFGVILSFKIKLVPVPKTVTVFKVGRTILEGAINMAYQWQRVASKLPRDLFIRVEADADKDSQNKKAGFVVFFYGQFLGKRASLLSLMDKKFPKLRLRKSECIEMSWIESTLFWYDYPRETPIEILLDRAFSKYFKHKSDYVKEPIPKKFIEKTYKKMIGSKKLKMQWNPYGGRMAEISESATPFPHRKGNLFKIQYLISWQEHEDEHSQRYIKIIRKFHEAMTPHVSSSPREAFLNYRDIDIGQSPSNHTNLKDATKYGTKFFKGNLKRLMRAKTVIDPTNFFKNEQSIPPLGGFQGKKNEGIEISRAN